MELLQAQIILFFILLYFFITIDPPYNMKNDRVLVSK